MSFGKLFWKSELGVTEHISATQTVPFKTSGINTRKEKKYWNDASRYFQRKDVFLSIKQYLYSQTLLCLFVFSDKSRYISSIVYTEIYHSMKYYKFRKAIKRSILEFTSRVNEIFGFSLQKYSSRTKLCKQNLYFMAMYAFFYLSMQEYHHGHANGAVTNKTTPKLVSRERRVY